MHNGVLKDFGNEKIVDSDDFFRSVILKIPHKMLFNEGTSKLLTLMAKYNASKFVIMSPRKIEIFNKEAGNIVSMVKDKTTIGDIWFSNSTYLEKTYNKVYNKVNSPYYTNVNTYNYANNFEYDPTVKYCTVCGSLLKTENEKIIKKCIVHSSYKFRSDSYSNKRCTYCGKVLTTNYEFQEGACLACIIDYYDKVYD